MKQKWKVVDDAKQYAKKDAKQDAKGGNGEEG